MADKWAAVFDIDAKQSHRQLNQLSKDAVSLRGELKDIRKEQDQYNKESQKLEKTRAQYNALEKEATQLKNETKNLDKSSQEYIEKTKQLKVVERRMNSMQRRIKETEAGMKDMTKAQEDYIKKSKQLRNANNQMQALRKQIGLSGLSLKELRQEQQRLSAAFEKARPGTKQFKQLRSEMGKVEKQMKKLSEETASFGASWKSMVAVIGGAALVNELQKVAFSIDDTRTQIERLAGISGEPLRQATDQISILAKTFNKDIGELTIAANAFSKRMGISFTESIDLIEAGFRRGADANGEFLETLKEYPTFFKEAGLSAEETIAIISQMPATGVYSDKGVDVIKEATLRLREMTTSTSEAIEAIGISSVELEKKLREGTISYFEAIQMVSDRMGELPEQSVEVGTAIADIFGGAGEDAGLAFIKGLAGMETSLENVAEVSLSAREELRLMLAEMLSSEGIIGKALNTIVIGLKNLLKWVKDNVDTIIIFAKTVIVAATALVSYKLAAMAAGIQLSALQEAVDLAKIAFHGLNKTMRANPIGFIIAGIAAAITAFVLFQDEINGTAKELTGLAKMQNELKKIEDKHNKSLAEQQAQLKALFEQLKKTNPETDERRKLVNQLNDQFPQLLSNYDLEKISVDQLTAAYAELNSQLIARVRQTIFQEQLTVIEKSVIPLEKNIQKFITDIKNQGIELEGTLEEQIQSLKIIATIGLAPVAPEGPAAVPRRGMPGAGRRIPIPTDEREEVIELANQLIPLLEQRREILNNIHNVTTNIAKIPPRIIPGTEAKDIFKAKLFIKEQLKQMEQIEAARRKLTQAVLTEEQREIIVMREKYNKLILENDGYVNIIIEEREKLLQLQRNLTDKEQKFVAHSYQRVAALSELKNEIIQQQEAKTHALILKQLDERLKKQGEADKTELDKLRGLLPEQEQSYKERLRAAVEYYDTLIFEAQLYTDKERIEMMRREEILKADSQEKIEIINKHYDELINNIQQNADLEIKMQEAKAEVIKEINKDMLLDMADETEKYTGQLFELNDSLLQMSQNRADKEITALERTKKADTEMLKSRLAQNQITQRAHDVQMERLEEEARKKAAEIKREQWIKQHNADLAQAAINIALGITRAMAEEGPIIGPILAGAIGAIQFAAIASQPMPEFAKGGIISGPGHDRGGVAITDGSGRKIAEAEGGEAFRIISREDTQRMMRGMIPSMLPQVNHNRIVNNSKTVTMAEGGIIPAPAGTEKDSIVQFIRRMDTWIADHNKLHTVLRTEFKITDLETAQGRRSQIQTSAELR